MRLLQVFTVLFAECFFRLARHLEPRWYRPQLPEVWIEATSTRFEPAIHLIVVGHKYLRHILLKVIAQEDTSSRLHCLLNVAFCQACRHHDLLVVGLIRVACDKERRR